MTMKKMTADDPESRSPDLVAENVERLKALFPELVTEGPNGAAVNVDVLKALVGDATVTDADEKYGLNWHGKRRARQLALTPSAGTLRPCPEDSVDWDTTQNLMIEGDNLEVLKLLQKSYAGKVKLIYIDPPYNTGKDFVYPDDFRDNVRNYLLLTGQLDGEEGKVSSNTEASGRFHTDWLTMLYPRIKLARTLLRDDGLLLVSIDEREVANLRHLLNELFGEENAIGTIVWKGATDNNPTQIAMEHEYLLCFGRSKEVSKGVWKNASDEGKEILLAEYRRLADDPNLDIEAIQARLRSFIRANKDSLAAITHYDRVDEKGVYTGSRKVHNPKPGGYLYDVIHPETRKVCSPPVNGYRYPEERMREIEASGRLLYGEDESQIVQIKEYLDDYKGKLSSVFALDSRAGANELNALFGAQKIFSNPKPTALLRHVFEFLLDPDDIVLDFFAGSGTTGHVAWQLNERDGGNRRFLLVQLPEPLDHAQADQKPGATYCENIGRPKNICELTKERLRLSAQSIHDANPLFSSSLGFRVFKLDSSNIRAWDPDRDDLDKALLESVEHLTPGRTEADVLYELLLKLGLDLCVPIEKRTLGGKDVHAVGGGVLMACLAGETISRGDVETLAQGIVEWHEALAPAGDTTCVFRDSAFADDVAKTNLAAILEQHGIANVRSL